MKLRCTKHNCEIELRDDGSRKATFDGHPCVLLEARDPVVGRNRPHGHETSGDRRICIAKEVS